MNDAHATTDEKAIESRFVKARFPIHLNLPESSTESLADAQEAVKREFRDSVKWKRLRCRSFTVLSESDTGTVYVLEIGHAVEFDWTWEGAVAFRPLVLKEFAENPRNLFDCDADDPEIEDSILWSGEILEVDEANGRIFVCVSNPEKRPTIGSFYVRPFDFLAFLNAVFHEPSFDTIRQNLPSRLLASEGGVHPDVDGYCKVGLPQLENWWGRSWSVLWGPPGTGKTYTTGHQVARVLADPSERILVVSTTNRATDASAIAIGRAGSTFASDELASGAILRIGKGASLKMFEAEDLTSLLKGTETEFLAKIDEFILELAGTLSSERKALIRKQIKDLRQRMRDAAHRVFLDPDVRVVISTAFRATAFLKSEDVKAGLKEGFAPFTTVFIDEAGLVSRAAVAALSLLASRRVVLVGDSKQLAPISKISRILPTNQMTWLANSGLSHLDSITTSETGVHVLQEQRRMHADVCSVVSDYQYDGFLTTAPEIHHREYPISDMLRGQSRTIWYVLDEDGEDLPTIRAERGPGNRSWVRVSKTRIAAR